MFSTNILDQLELFHSSRLDVLWSIVVLADIVVVWP